MKNRKRWGLSLVVAICILGAVLAYVYREGLLTRWHLYQLASEDEAQVMRSLEWLIALPVPRAAEKIFSDYVERSREAKHPDELTCQDDTRTAFCIARRGYRSCGETGLRVLLEALKDPVDSVERLCAIQLLRTYGEDAAPATDILIEIVTDEPNHVLRELAIATLGAIGPPAKRALPILIRLAEDPSSVGLDAQSFETQSLVLRTIEIINSDWD